MRRLSPELVQRYFEFMGGLSPAQLRGLDPSEILGNGWQFDPQFGAELRNATMSAKDAALNVQPGETMPRGSRLRGDWAPENDRFALEMLNSPYLMNTTNMDYIQRAYRDSQNRTLPWSSMSTLFRWANP